MQRSPFADEVRRFSRLISRLEAMRDSLDLASTVANDKSAKPAAGSAAREAQAYEAGLSAAFGIAARSLRAALQHEQPECLLRSFDVHMGEGTAA